MLALLIAVPLLVGQADCQVDPPGGGPSLPLSLNLPGGQGEAQVMLPLTPPGMACSHAPPPPADVLRGEPGDLLRGPGRPSVRIEELPRRTPPCEATAASCYR